MKKFAAPFAIGTLFVSQALAASATGTADANVVSSLAITETTPMNFGSIAAGSQQSTVTTDGVVIGGDATIVSQGNDAIFRVTGTPNQNFTASLANVTLLTSGANTMGFLVGGSILPRQLSAAGTYDLSVYGMAVVDANQPPGLYTASYAVNVNY